MLRAVITDVIYGLIISVHESNREDWGEKFGFPVFFGGFFDVVNQIMGTLAVTELDAFFLYISAQVSQQSRCNFMVYQQGFHSATNTITISFGIDGNCVGFGQISIFVDVDMAIVI